MSLETQVAPQTRAELRRIWVAVGPGEVAKALSSAAISDLVDDIAGRFDKRRLAHEWLTETLSRSETERLWTNRRSWIALVLSAVAIVVAITLHFVGKH